LFSITNLFSFFFKGHKGHEGQKGHD
jgi:hypothetical protein